MSKQTFLFVDGSNLYGAQYELFGPGKYLSFSKLIKQLEETLLISFSKIYFYASYSPMPKKPSKKQLLYIKNEGLFYKDVRNTDKVEFFKGYRSPTSGKEKEVDVKLAVDIVDYAHRNNYSQLYLISGDADFLHALLAVKKLKKDINLLCMSNKILYRGLIHFQTNIMVFDNKMQKIKGYTNKPKLISLESDKLITNLLP